ncbi:ABC transporter B family member 5 [Planktothrix tepida]|uniref:ABC transporter related n=1 Tax=Planktothrix tepida PCC 9214 TaxID=671072 RepID=A0A1J1LJG1_9CYAN|nr:ABC transporter ATP-binding protein [Planktothrix tepida]CAD5951765.1 ABC transporter B family member 5 [Planktothrix tepida]CUR32648.1 ABC transporter related [Planktothrix tepida PCC 9214]
MENQPLKSSFVLTLKFIWRYCSEYRYAILLLLFLMTVQTILQALVPVLTGKLVNSFSYSIETWTVPVFICAYLGAAKLTSYLCRIGAAAVLSNTATQVMKKIITESFDKVQHFSTEWHIDNFSGSVIRNINRGIWGFDQLSNTLSMSVYPSLLMMVSLIVIFFINGFWIGVTGFVGFGLFLLVTYNLSTHYLAQGFEEFNQIDTDLNGSLSDVVICNSVVKFFATEDYESQKFEEIAETWRDKSQRVWWRIETAFSAQNLLLWVMEVVIIGLSIWLWFKGIRTPGDVITILTSFQMAQGQMTTVGNDLRLLQKSMIDLQGLINLDEVDAQIVDSPEAVALEIKDGSIAFDQVTFRYKNQTTPIYENLSVTIAGGEKVALVGHSGSGKSTFMKLLQRLYDIENGQITIDGQNIQNITKQSLRSAIAVVPQEPILFHRSIAENIGYGKPDATQDEIEQAARQAYAHDFIMGLPEGYETQVGERGTKLSGGEHQRIAIARAILINSPILILDEATSSLDSVSEILIQKALNNLMAGRTTIIIAHRLSTIQAVDRILVFSQGKIIEEGSQETLLANSNSHYRVLYALQSNGFLPETPEDSNSKVEQQVLVQ